MKHQCVIFFGCLSLLFQGLLLANEGAKGVLPTSPPFTHLDQVCYLGAKTTSVKHMMNAPTVFVMNDNHKGIALLYALDKHQHLSHLTQHQHIIEFNQHNRQLKINNQPYSPDKHNLKNIIHCDYLAGFGYADSEYMQKVLAEDYGIHLQLIVDSKSHLLIESKTNTTEAMLLLKARDHEDARMRFYLDMFLPETGFIHDRASLFAILVRYAAKGVVFKLAESSAGSGVFIIKPSFISEVLSLQKSGVKDPLQPFSMYPALYKAMLSNAPFTWQAYFSDDEIVIEKTIQFVNNDSFTHFYTTSEVIDNTVYLGSLFEGDTFLSEFADLPDDAARYYRRITKALMDIKVNLSADYSMGLADPALVLRSFDTSVIVTKKNGLRYPVISEINARLSLNPLLVSDVLLDKNFAAAQGHGYMWLRTERMPVPPNADVSRVADALSHALKVVRERYPHKTIDMSRLLAPVDLKTVTVYLAIRPIAKGEVNFCKGVVSEFMALFAQALSAK